MGTINMDKLIFWDERQLKALIWLGREEFNFLAGLYWEIDVEIKEREYKERLSKRERGKQVRIWSKSWNTKLDSYEKKLFFLLYYLKTYPTYDVLWFTFWISRGWACQNIHRSFPILQEMLQNLWVSPKRELKTYEDLKEAFDWDILDLIVDWTERPYFRNKDSTKQKENYSGKKKDTEKIIQ